MSERNMARPTRLWSLVFLLGAVAFFALSALGVLRGASTAPWIAGPLLAAVGAIGLLRWRRQRRAAALAAVGIVLALAAPFAQVVGLRIENGFTEREVLAELAGRPAPPLAAQHRLNGADALPERPDEVTVVNYWATWCPPCIEELPMLQEFAAEHRGDALRLVGATALYRGPPDEELARIRAFLHERGVTYPNLVSADGDLQRSYRAFTLPTTVLLDGGRVVGYGIGIRGTERLLEDAERRLEREGRSQRPDQGQERSPDPS